MVLMPAREDREQDVQGLALQLDPDLHFPGLLRIDEDGLLDWPLPRGSHHDQAALEVHRRHLILQQPSLPQLFELHLRGDEAVRGASSSTSSPSTSPVIRFLDGLTVCSCANVTQGANAANTITLTETKRCRTYMPSSFRLLAPNDQDKLPGQLQGRYDSKSRHADPVNFIASLGENV